MAVTIKYDPRTVGIQVGYWCSFRLLEILILSNGGRQLHCSDGVNYTQYLDQRDGCQMLQVCCAGPDSECCSRVLLNAYAYIQMTEAALRLACIFLYEHAKNES